MEKRVNTGLAEQLTRALNPPKPAEVPEASRIVVHAAVSRFSVLYERIRNAVDYKDEHLLRKAAIIRILKRQLVLENDPAMIAENLVRELIGARYLPNGELSESVIGETAVRVKKYQEIERTRIGTPAHFEWLKGVLAAEIEDLLVDASREKGLITFLYERLAGRIRVQGMTLDESDLRLQIYVACYRCLVKADDEMLSFKLLRAYVPEWLRPTDWIDDPRPMAEQLVAAERRIKASLAHPLAQRFVRVVKPWAVALNMLVAAVSEKPADVQRLFEKPEALDAAVHLIAERRYREAKARLRRGAVRAMLYLAVTKMLIAFAIEVPLEYLWYKAVAVPALVINLVFPPTLMLFVWLFIKVPGKENTDRIQANARILLSASGIPQRDIRVAGRRSAVARFLLSLTYAATFFLTFGAIAAILLALRFTWVSATIFLFFLCLVSFFAFRLRQNAREDVIVEGKESFRSVVIDFVSIPILRAGQWLSRSISRINVFLFFFDFLFEAPFKLFLTVLEEWFAFLKEKKEELQ